MSTTIISGPMRILRKWLQLLGIRQVDPILTEGDLDFWSVMSTALDAALELIRDDFQDHVGPEIAQWGNDIAAVAA